MMRVFLINLPNAQERFLKMQEQFEQLAISFEHFPAVDGRKLTPAELSQIYDAEKALEMLGRELRPAEIGCSASHMQIYRKMVEENIEVALVIEDDARIGKAINTLITQIEQDNNHRKRDYLSLNYTLFDWENLKSFWQHLYQNLFKKGRVISALAQGLGSIACALLDRGLILLAKIGGNLILPAYKPMYLTGGYFISLAGAKKLLAIHSKIFLPADVFVEYARKGSMNEGKLKFWVSVPMLIRQDQTLASSIQEK